MLLGRAGRLVWFVPVAAAVVVAIDLVAGSRWEGYDRRSQYLSELGAKGAPDGVVVSVGFVVVGLLLAAAAVGVRRAGPRALATIGVLVVAGGFAVSYAVSGIARCDPGCGEVEPVSTSQEVHDVVGALGYTAAVIGLAVVALARPPTARGRVVRVLAAVAAPVVAVLSALMADEARRADRGLHQRLAEAVVFGWLALAVAVCAPSVRSDASPVRVTRLPSTAMTRGWTYRAAAPFVVAVAVLATNLGVPGPAAAQQPGLPGMERGRARTPAWRRRCTTMSRLGGPSTRHRPSTRPTRPRSSRPSGRR